MRRVLALLLSPLAVASLAMSCSSDSGGEGGGTTAPVATTTKPSYTDLDATSIIFHPVLEIVTCEAGVPGVSTDGTATTDTGAVASTSSTVPAADGNLCYVLGPAGGDGTDLRDAKVYADGVGIEVAVREDSVAAMNELFDACFEATDACPASSSEGRGYAAIVVDGRVVSTPAVQEGDLASSPFVITGNFDQTQATNIAAAINAR